MSEETRCSCGARLVICRGEYHDCAVERGVALQRRQVEALERIASTMHPWSLTAVRLDAVLEILKAGRIDEADALRLLRADR